ncbi:MAG TPA: COX15/CtaA family protein [Candidatus Binatia bacterium]|nr:COX15/CtaA family protein [Candidatus Binatia bacterium]
MIPQPSSFSVWPHRLAVVLASATFPLLFIGGLVTSKGAGLAVPDWPTTFGYNMFLYPWSKMVGDIFYEHSHRLVASGVGLATIALTLALWLREPRSWLRWLGVAALVLVILQGVIGGLRVVLLENTLAIVHAAFAQLFFGLTVSLAIFTSREWDRESSEPPNPLFVPLLQRGKEGDFALLDGGRLARLCAITTGLIYIQAVFGAVLRHTGERLDAHLIFAALVMLHVVFILLRVIKFHADRPKIAWPARLLGSLLLFQFVLGLISYFGKFTTMLGLPPDVLVLLTTTHLVVGALMLATSLLLTLRTYRLAAAKPWISQKVLAEHFSR